MELPQGSELQAANLKKGVAAEALAIVLVNYNGWAHTIECLESLLRSDRLGFPILVVDNASTDDSVVQILAWAEGCLAAWVLPGNPHRTKVCPPVAKPLMLRIVDDQFQDLEESVSDGRIILVKSSRNGGFGAGNNLGMNCALSLNLKPDFFWLLNNDTVVGSDAVGIVLDALTGGRRVWGTWLMEYAEPEVIQVIGGCRLTRFAKRSVPCRSIQEINRLDYIQGASMIFPTTFFREVGGFDQSIFMYYEDPDICLSAREKGYSLDVIKASVFHKGGVSSHSVRQWIWTYRHKFYVMHKHFGWKGWAVANGINLILVILSPFTDPAKRKAAKILLREGKFGTISSNKNQKTD